ncbi:MAG: DUF3501 family protein [Gammaproteobacteria bacterium]|nr:DUF3501 family protein [Gammaproteobacteria bacterium]MBI5618109.1 DUF3501 family protein [Gammaproteobacteria bacterium]
MKLTRDDLMSLERYHTERAAFRARVLAHKAARKVFLGAHAALYFEDRLTIQYQIQEMLRVERIFEAEAVQDELDAYNPLIPDGDNWKATFMLEHERPEERRAALERLVGIEHRVWVRIGAAAPILAVADEDLNRTTDSKTSAVHFLRFQLDATLIAAAHAGAPVAFGIDHPACFESITVPEATRVSLIGDLATH